MATVNVPWDWFVFKMKAYWYIAKVTKIEVPTAYHFSTVKNQSVGRFRLPPPRPLPL